MDLQPGNLTMTTVLCDVQSNTFYYITSLQIESKKLYLNLKNNHLYLKNSHTTNDNGRVTHSTSSCTSDPNIRPVIETRVPNK